MIKCSGIVWPRTFKMSSAMSRALSRHVTSVELSFGTSGSITQYTSTTSAMVFQFQSFQIIQGRLCQQVSSESVHQKNVLLIPSKVLPTLLRPWRDTLDATCLKGILRSRCCADSASFVDLTHLSRSWSHCMRCQHHWLPARWGCWGASGSGGTSAHSWCAAFAHAPWHHVQTAGCISWCALKTLSTDHTCTELNVFGLNQTFFLFWVLGTTSIVFMLVMYSMWLWLWTPSLACWETVLIARTCFHFVS